MSDDRLPTGLWIEARLRQLTEAGIPYYIANKGAYASGTVILKLSLLQGNCRLLGQVRDENGALAWMPMLKTEMVAESDADAYIRRAIDRDPDVWVIEIEDRTGTNPFEGKLLS
jgi:hypothetical protein